MKIASLSLLLLAGAASAGGFKGLVVPAFDQDVNVSAVLEAAREEAALDQTQVPGAPVLKYRVTMKLDTMGNEVWACRDAQGLPGYNQFANKLKALRTQKDLECADLSGVTPSYAVRLRNRNLRGANFRNAVLPGADFSGSDLSYAVLLGASLPVHRPNIRRGNRFVITPSFAKAKLVRANLRGADVASARIKGADFAGALFSPSSKLPFSEAEALKRGMIKQYPRGKGSRRYTQYRVPKKDAQKPAEQAPAAKPK